MPSCLELETPTRPAYRKGDAATWSPAAAKTDWARAEPAGGDDRVGIIAASSAPAHAPPSLHTRGRSRAGRQREVLPSRGAPRFCLYQRGRVHLVRTRLRVDSLRSRGDDVALDDASVFVGRRLRDDGWRVEQLRLLRVVFLFRQDAVVVERLRRPELFRGFLVHWGLPESTNFCWGCAAREQNRPITRIDSATDRALPLRLRNAGGNSNKAGQPSCVGSPRGAAPPKKDISGRRLRLVSLRTLLLL